MGKGHDVAGHSIRISLSYLTSEEDIHIFVENFKECVQKLKF